MAVSKTKKRAAPKEAAAAPTEDDDIIDKGLVDDASNQVEAHNKKASGANGSNGSKKKPSAETTAEEHEAALDALDPSSKPADEADINDEEPEHFEDKSAPKRWVIGKPPEEGGDKDEYEVYMQEKLGYMARNRFFSLTARTMSRAIKASGGQALTGMEDVFGGEGTLQERGRRLRERDFADASSFFTLAMELVGYSPDYLNECYAMWLNVPIAKGERAWFKEVIEEDWDPKSDKWGITEAQGMEMIEIFIDQNYEDIRRFFAETLPAIGRRVAARERERAARESD